MVGTGTANCDLPLLHKRPLRTAQPGHLEAADQRPLRLAANGVAGSDRPSRRLCVGSRLGVAGDARVFPDLADALCTPGVDLSVPTGQDQQPDADAADAAEGDADADARRVLDAAVDPSVWTMEKLQPDIDILAAGTGQEVHTEGAGETLQIDDNLGAPLKRGQLVLVKPLNLRGQVVRNWVRDPESEASVEVDVHGKRLIVSREQVRLLVI